MEGRDGPLSGWSVMGDPTIFRCYNNNKIESILSHFAAQHFLLPRRSALFISVIENKFTDQENVSVDLMRDREEQRTKERDYVLLCISQ